MRVSDYKTIKNYTTKNKYLGQNKLSTRIFNINNNYCKYVKKMVSSYIYLIQDTKYNNQNIYKIGRTTQNGDCRKITRLQCYTKYSNIEYIRQVNTELVINIEAKIIEEFNKKFELIEGNEWFKGEKLLMINIINSIIDKYIINVENTPNQENTINNIELDNSELNLSLVNNIDILDYVKIFKNLYGNYFIYNSKTNIFYCYNRNFWEQNDIIFKQYISNQLHDYLYDYININKSNINNYSKTISRLARLKNITYKTELLKTYKDFCINDSINFDDKLNLLGFNNLVYDLESGDMREYKYDDYISITTSYDWREPTDEEMQTMSGLIELIMPHESEREAYLQILSTALNGKCLEKFIIFNGSGGNGKGMINDMLVLALGDYAMIGNNSILFEKPKSGANPEKANIHKKRLVIFREPPENKRFENSIIKELTGGGYISARGLREGNTQKELNLTLIVECNKRPLFKEEPTDADARRIVDLLFRSSFVDRDELLDDNKYIYKANTNLKTKEFQEQHKFALLKILMNTYQKYKGMNYNFELPHTVVERGNQYLELSCNIVQWFKDNYEETTKTTYVHVKDVYELFIMSEFINSLTKKERLKYTRKYFVEYIQDNIFFRPYYAARYNDVRTVIKGWRKRQQTE